MIANSRVAVTTKLLIFLLLCLPLAGPLRAGDDWIPVTPADLSLKSDSAVPGAHAIILYREYQCDDVESFERHYKRVKILTEEGKKYGDIEIPYFKEAFSIRDIKARTIRPDGSIVPFQGKVFEKTVIKGRGFKFLAKTFSFPEVQVGSIIEYRYKLTWDVYKLFSTRWVMQDDLFTRHAKFSLRPYSGQPLRWMNYHLPPESVAKEGKGGIIGLEMDNIPAFQEEDYMPPPEELKMRVDFYYSRVNETNPEKFWAQVGKTSAEEPEKFIGHRKGVEQAVSQIVAPGDPPETKLRKLYARAQQIRNLSYEVSKTDKEDKREKIKENQNSEDVLKRGYASGPHINWTFVAMARAAGFEAYPLISASRNVRFFNRRMLDPSLFNADLAWVRLPGNPGKEYFLDPATLHCPFGILPWEETGVDSLLLNKQDPQFVFTPMPLSSDAVIQRNAALKLDDEGKLAGELQVTFLGIEALRRRRANRTEDEMGRKKILEDEAKEWLPIGSTVELAKAPNWDSSDPALEATFKIEIFNWGTHAGRRLLMPLAILVGSNNKQFTPARRVNPVYFEYPFKTDDEVTVQLPLLISVGSTPPERTMKTSYGSYEASCQKQGTGFKFVRRLAMDRIFFPVDTYPAIRAFFQNVRSSD